MFDIQQGRGGNCKKMSYLSKPQPNLNQTMSAESQLLVNWFWWNFKCRFLGTFRTDPDSHSDICHGNICPGDICPYQEYLSCYWPDFDQTLKVSFWEYVKQIPTVNSDNCPGNICPGDFVHIRNISAVTDQILAQTSKVGEASLFLCKKNLGKIS